MTLTPDIMKAILSMDAYNRGYDAGITLTSVAGTQIGDASILTTSSLLEDENGNPNIDDEIGFYALAYEYNGDVVISYRGTNAQPLDLYHGWTLGAGNTDSEQGRMANDNSAECSDVCWRTA